MNTITVATDRVNGMWDHLPLTSDDIALLHSCGISDDVILAAKIFRVDSQTGAEIVGREDHRRTDYSGLVYPNIAPEAPHHVRGYRLRLDNPGFEQRPDGRVKSKPKYLTSPGTNYAYFVPGTTVDHLAADSPILITEGEKKALSLAGYAQSYAWTRGRDYLPIGLSGVWNWRGRTGTETADDGSRQPVTGPLPDLRKVRWEGRQVYIIFDNDVATNPKVAHARRALTNCLTSWRAIVRHVNLPADERIKGVDDLLGLRDGAERLTTLIDQSSIESPSGRVYYAGARDLVDAAREVLPDLADDEADRPTLFIYQSVPARCTPQLDRLNIEPLTEDRLSYRLAHLGRWRVTRDHEDPTKHRYTAPPKALVKHILAAPPADLPLPVLERYVTVPVLTAAGEILTTPGYDRTSKIYYIESVAVPPLPAVVTDADVAAAKSLLVDDLLVDFPLSTPADRANAIALLLLPFVRDLVKGPTPLFLVEAATPGSGKSLLASSLLSVGVGESSVAVLAHAVDDAEMTKAITGVLMSGMSGVLIDNLRGTLDSPPLAAALTGKRWSERLLGTPRMVDCSIRCQWVATGNNTSLSAEMVRRCVRIRLEPTTDRPEDRTGFKHSPLGEWVDSHRGELVRACLVLCRRWLDAGRPAGRQTMGSYESFAGVMGGVLDAAGIQGFLGNVSEFRERVDVERESFGALCRQWYEWSERNSKQVSGASAGEIWDNVAQHVDGLPLYGTTAEALRTNFGKFLTAKQDTYATYFDGESRTTQTFHVRKRKGLVRGRQNWLIDLVSEE